jgi:hypothetical protein
VGAARDLKIKSKFQEGPGEAGKRPPKNNILAWEIK